MFRRFIKIAAFVCIPVAGGVACSSREIVMAEDLGQPVEFAPVDSGTTDGDVDAGGLISYCPVDQVPSGLDDVSGLALPVRYQHPRRLEKLRRVRDGLPRPGPRGRAIRVQ